MCEQNELRLHSSSLRTNNRKKVMNKKSCGEINKNITRDCLLENNSNNETTVENTSGKSSRDIFLNILNKTVSNAQSTKRPQTSKITDIRMKVLNNIDKIFNGKSILKRSLSKSSRTSLSNVFSVKSLLNKSAANISIK